MDYSIHSTCLLQLIENSWIFIHFIKGTLYVCFIYITYNSINCLKSIIKSDSISDYFQHYLNHDAVHITVIQTNDTLCIAPKIVLPIHFLYKRNCSFNFSLILQWNSWWKKKLNTQCEPIFCLISILISVCWDVKGHSKEHVNNKYLQIENKLMFWREK